MSSKHLQLPSIELLGKARKALSGVTNVNELEAAFREYNSKEWTEGSAPNAFSFALGKYAEGTDAVTFEAFFTGENALLQAIMSLACNVHELTRAYCDSNRCHGIPLLFSGESKVVVLSRELVSSVLACAFLGLLEEPSMVQSGSDHYDFNSLSFNSLQRNCAPQEVAKLQCFLNYFRAVTQQAPKGYVAIHRKVAGGFSKELKSWQSCQLPLLQPEVFGEGSMCTPENDCHVDFANMYLGGGVLSGGCVQEEIMFAEAPELVMTTILCEVMKDDEAVVMTGTEHFSTTQGYAFSLKYAGNASRSASAAAACGCIKSSAIAIDALCMGRGTPQGLQCGKEYFMREVVKCFAGFHHNPALVSWNETSSCPPSSASVDCGAGSACGENCPTRSGLTSFHKVATGNWGCGVFGGDTEVKSLVQWMVLSSSGRKMKYYTFFNQHLTDGLEGVVRAIMMMGPSRATVGWLFKTMMEYGSMWLEGERRADEEYKASQVKKGGPSHIGLRITSPRASTGGKSLFEYIISQTEQAR